MNRKKNIFATSDCPSPEVLQNYLNNTLSKEEKRQVEEHLIDCEMCSDELEGLASMKDIEKLPEIIDDIQQELGISEAKKIRLRPVYQLAAAIAVLFIVAGSIFLTEYLSDNGTTEMVSQTVEETDNEKVSPVKEKSIAKTSRESKIEDEVVSSEKDSGKGMKRSDEIPEVKPEVAVEEINQKDVNVPEENPAVENGIIIVEEKDNDALVLEVEGAGITGDAEEVVFRGEKKNDMVMEEVTGQKSRASYNKSSRSKGQEFTLSTAPSADSASIYYNLKQHQKAIEYLKASLKYDKENDKILYELALNYFAIDDYKKSLKYISKLYETENPAYNDDCEALLRSIIEKSSKYRSRAEKLLDSIR